MGVETLVDECVLVRHRWERGAISYSRGIQATLISINETGSVGPAVVRIGRTVHGKNHIDMTRWLDKRIEWDVLVVLATVNDTECLGLSDQSGVLRVVVEGIDIISDILVIPAELVESIRDQMLKDVG